MSDNSVLFQFGVTMGTYSVLLIDKDIESCKQIKKVFKKPKYNLVIHTSSEKAYIESILTESFDFILIDQRIPFLNGEKFIKMVREISLNKNSFIISLVSNTQETGELFKTDFDDFITKPVNEIYLKNKLDNIYKKIVDKKDTSIKNNSFIEYENYDFTLNGIRLNFSNAQYKLFKFLLRNINKSLTTREIFLSTADFCKSEHCVRQQIGNIRKKINSVESEGNYLITVLQKGYILVIKNN